MPEAVGNGRIPPGAMLEARGKARSPQGGDEGLKLGRPGDVVPEEPETAAGGDYGLAQDFR